MKIWYLLILIITHSVHLLYISADYCSSKIGTWSTANVETTIISDGAILIFRVYLCWMRKNQIRIELNIDMCMYTRWTESNGPILHVNSLAATVESSLKSALILARVISFCLEFHVIHMLSFLTHNKIDSRIYVFWAFPKGPVSMILIAG